MIGIAIILFLSAWAFVGLCVICFTDERDTYNQSETLIFLGVCATGGPVLAILLLFAAGCYRAHIWRKDRHYYNRYKEKRK